MNEVAIVLAVLAFLAGALIGWLLASAARAAAESAVAELRRQGEGLQSELTAVRQQLQREQAARASAETAHTKALENLAEQKRQFDEAREKLVETFQALSSQALGQNNTEFLKLASATFQTLQKEAEGDLLQRQTAIAGLVDPLKTALDKFQDQIAQVESSRQKAYGELSMQVQQLSESSQQLRQETGSLVTSLRQPHIKGKWGELTLRRAAELTGMSPYCDFEEQPSAETEEGRLRPDLRVNLPGGRQVIVDAKVPLSAFLTALTARNQDEYRAAMGEHARLVRAHISQLASKKYWDQFSPDSPDFVVLFLPGESFFSAALEQDRTLIEDAMNKRVVLASPTTFLALLRAVAYGWNQQKTAEDARQIAELGKELHERMFKFLEHFNEVRYGLEKANKAYTQAVGSLESRLLPTARKFHSLAAPAAGELPEVGPIETDPRQLVLPEQ